MTTGCSVQLRETHTHTHTPAADETASAKACTAPSLRSALAAGALPSDNEVKRKETARRNSWHTWRQWDQSRTPRLSLKLASHFFLRIRKSGYRDSACGKVNAEEHAKCDRTPLVVDEPAPSSARAPCLVRVCAVHWVCHRKHRLGISTQASSCLRNIDMPRGALLSTSCCSRTLRARSVSSSA